MNINTWSGEDIRDRHPSPYPGLRPFRRKDAELFFGRGEQIDDMLKRLETHRFLAVIGASGSGKSSLVQAGLLPALEQGYLAGVREQWWIAGFRPGDDPYREMAAGLLRVKHSTDEARPELDAVIKETDIAYTASTLRSGRSGLLTALHDLHAPDDADVLILVDQFEELFRFRRLQEERAKREASLAGPSLETIQQEAAAFVNLLLESTRQTQRRVYVVITMRSDYLGDCDAFLGLPEAINECQFLTPRMTRDQLRDAIEGPLEAFGLEARVDFNDALVNTILNDVGTDPDQLPLMQHALMLTWWTADERRRSDKARRQSNDPCSPLWVTLDDYQTAGGFQSALSNHASQTLKELCDSAPDSTASRDRERVARRMFCLLCDFEPGGRITRRPTTVKEILEVSEERPLTEASSTASDTAEAPNDLRKAAAQVLRDQLFDEVRTVVAAFASPGRNFIVIDTQDSEKITLDTTVDISHEALLRQWTLLRGTWLPNEMKSAAFYQRLADQASRWKADPESAGTWDTPDLETALKWRDIEQRPTEAWARRYRPGLQLSDEFLAASVREQTRRRQEREALLAETRSAHDLRRRIRLLQVSFWGSMLVIACFIFLGHKIFQLRIEAETARGEAVDAKELANAAARLSRAQQCAALAELNLAQHPVLATILAAEAFQGLTPSDPIPQSVEQTLRNAMTKCTGRALIGHISPVTRASFDSHERWLATANDNELLLWDLKTDEKNWKPVRLLPEPRSKAPQGEEPVAPSRLIAVSFTDDGERLMALESSGIYWQWTLGDALELRHEQGRLSDIEAMVDAKFEEGGRRLVTRTKDGAVQLWNWPPDQTRKNASQTLTRGARSAAFVPDSEFLVTAGAFVQVWKLGQDGATLHATLSDGGSGEFTHATMNPRSLWIAAADSQEERSSIYAWRLDEAAATPNGVQLRPRADARFRNPDGNNSRSEVIGLATAGDGDTLVSVWNDRRLLAFQIDGVRLRARPSNNERVGTAGGDVGTEHQLSQPRVLNLDREIADMAVDPRSGFCFVNDGRNLIGWSSSDDRPRVVMGAVEDDSPVVVSRTGGYVTCGDRVWVQGSLDPGVSVVEFGASGRAVSASGQWAAGSQRQDGRTTLVVWRSARDSKQPFTRHRLQAPDDLDYPTQFKFNERETNLAAIYQSSASDKSPDANVWKLAVWSLEGLAKAGTKSETPVVLPNFTGQWDISERFVVSASESGHELTVWDLSQSPPTHQVVGQELEFGAHISVTRLRISPDGNWIAAMHGVSHRAPPDNNRVSIWKRSIDGKWNPYWQSRVRNSARADSPSGSLSQAILLGNRWCIVPPTGSGDAQNGVRAIRLGDAVQEFLLEGSEKANNVSLSQDERRLFVSMEDEYRVYALGETPLLVFESKPLWPSHVEKSVWSPDANWIVISSPPFAELLAVGEHLETDGASKRVRRFQLPAVDVGSKYCFRPDGKSLLVFLATQMITMPVGRAELLEAAQIAAGRNMTRGEWAESLPDDPRTGLKTFDDLGVPLLRREYLTQPRMSIPPFRGLPGTIVFHPETLPPLAGADSSVLLQSAWDAWSGGSDFLYPNSSNEIKDCDVCIRTGPIDGPGGVRSFAKLGPPTRGRRIELWFDSADEWTAESFYQAAVREIGHVLGLEDTDLPDQLMSKRVNPAIRTPQADDLKRLKEAWKRSEPQRVSPQQPAAA